jgi:hypothetical protein
VGPTAGLDALKIKSLASAGIKLQFIGCPPLCLDSRLYLIHTHISHKQRYKQNNKSLIILFMYHKNIYLFIFILDIMMFTGLRPAGSREKAWVLMPLLHDVIIAAFELQLSPSL